VPSARNQVWDYYTYFLTLTLKLIRNHTNPDANLTHPTNPPDTTNSRYIMLAQE